MKVCRLKPRNQELQLPLGEEQFSDDQCRLVRSYAFEPCLDFAGFGHPHLGVMERL
jgi:hypothetical protein